MCVCVCVCCFPCCNECQLLCGAAKTSCDVRVPTLSPTSSLLGSCQHIVLGSLFGSILHWNQSCPIQSGELVLRVAPSHITISVLDPQIASDETGIVRGQGCQLMSIPQALCSIVFRLPIESRVWITAVWTIAIWITTGQLLAAVCYCCVLQDAFAMCMYSMSFSNNMCVCAALHGDEHPHTRRV